MATSITREQGYIGFSPEIVRIVTTSTLAQVTTAGWYNNSPIAGESLANVDLALICYAYASSSQATALFSVSISAKGVVTFALAESNVILPVVSGDVAIFSGTSGSIADSGILATNLVVKNAANQMAAGAEILFDKGTGTVSTGAVTINKQSGVITAAVTTAGAATTSVTFNNSEIASTSVLLVSLMGGTNTTLPGPQVNCVYTSPGIATINITNNNVAGTALNGNLLIGFAVL